MIEAERAGTVKCSVCGRSFFPRFSFQRVTEDGVERHYCSQRCQIEARKSRTVRCSVCGESFTPKFAYQRAIHGERTSYYCSEKCAESFRVERRRAAGKRRIAVLNQKGGTGKTTTAINLAAGFAAKGLRVLLIDMDAQGNVGVSLGVNWEAGAYHLLMENKTVDDCAVPIRKNLDVIVSNESLAAAEILMANMENRERFLKNAMTERGGEEEYDCIILDCPPALSLVNQNALFYADEIIVPVSCDYLAMIGVKQILRTLDRMNNLMGSKVDICGILPTFFDVRTRLSGKVVDNLTDYFKEKMLPPIRVSQPLKEAPIHGQTIFEYAPRSHGAEDYLNIVNRLIT